MTRQYKAMKEELMKKVTDLESNLVTTTEKLGMPIKYLIDSWLTCYHRVSSLCTSTEAMRFAKDELERKKDQQLATKQAEIMEHKARMEDMAMEFSQMLKVSFSFFLLFP
jgi:hypothetical protein